MKALQITNVTGLHSLPVQPAQVGAVPLQTTVVPLDSTDSTDNSILSGGLLSTIIEFMLVMMIMKMMMGMMSGVDDMGGKPSNGPVTYPYAKG
jgi:hypothetical protein